MKPVRPGQVSGSYLAFWHKLTQEMLIKLIISPDRVEAIQKVWAPPENRSSPTAEEVLFPHTLSAKLDRQKETDPI